MHGKKAHDDHDALWALQEELHSLVRTTCIKRGHRTLSPSCTAGGGGRQGGEARLWLPDCGPFGCQLSFRRKPGVLLAGQDEGGETDRGRVYLSPQ